MSALFFASAIYAENSIIAIVDKEPITLNELALFSEKSSTKGEKLEIINLIINSKIEGKKIQEFNINPDKRLINSQLSIIADKNNISLTDLINSKNFGELLSKIKYQLSKETLINLVYQDTLKNKPAIDDKLIIYKEWFDKVKANTFIEIYEDKL